MNDRAKFPFVQMICGFNLWLSFYVWDCYLSSSYLNTMYLSVFHFHSRSVDPDLMVLQQYQQQPDASFGLARPR